MRNQRIAFRTVFGTLLLTTLVLSNLYTSVFTSLLAVPYFKVIANNIEEVADNPSIRVHAYNLSGTTDYVLVCKNLFFFINTGLMLPKRNRALKVAV